MRHPRYPIGQIDVRHHELKSEHHLHPRRDGRRSARGFRLNSAKLSEIMAGGAMTSWRLLKVAGDYDEEDACLPARGCDDRRHVGRDHDG
jgi:hypothetical protein